MREEQEAEEFEPWSGSEDTANRSSSSSKDSSSNARSEQSAPDEQSPWKWLGQPVGRMSINEGKKQQALEACAELHGALLGCLKKGKFADCAEPQKAFWDCYQTHRYWLKRRAFAETRSRHGLLHRLLRVAKSRRNAQELLRTLRRISTLHGAVACIISNHPMTLEQDRMRKRLPRGAETWVATLIPGLPDDVVRRILVKLPRSNWLNLRLVSKAWRQTVEDPSFYNSRVDMKLTEEWCYTEVWHPETRLVSWFAFDFNQCAWTALPQIPRKRGLDPEIFGRASSSLRGELYVVGGKAGVSGPTLREMFIYSPFTHRWRKGKSMIITRHSPLMFSIYECKIYVMGGFDFLNNTIESGECYDADTGEWTLVGNVGYPEVICPSWYQVGWRVQWTQFHFNDDEHFISYKTIDEKQLVKCYVPRKGMWVFTEHLYKAKALMRYSLGGIVNMNVIMLDWANGRFRYRYHPSRNVGFESVPGLAELNWVAIWTSNPKVSAYGSKLVLVVRGLSTWLIETNPTLLRAKDRTFIDFLPAKPDTKNLEPLGCVTVVA